MDSCHYLIRRLLQSGKNRRFTALHPDIALPPPYLVYESFQMDYEKYFLGGRQTAEWIASRLLPYLDGNTKNILDWGCGPARVIRHLPEILGNRYRYFGCDYNAATIHWCTQNISNVQFTQNSISPPLPYPPETFDAVYGISIFTHLSAANHRAWLEELRRILASGGVLLITTHGEIFKEKLTAEEQRSFDAGQLVIRGKAKEGQRMFGAFHPPVFMRMILSETGFDIEGHTPGIRRATWIEQDTWILRKKYDQGE
jgi:SAM-dependent methyltransferase